MHENFGSNFRLTEFQSAIGREQLKRIDNWLDIRERNAKILIEKLADLKVLYVPIPSKEIIHAWYKFHCFLVLEELSENWNREKIVDEINSYGYPAYYGSCSEIYLEECFEKNNYKPEYLLANAKELSTTNLMFLVHPTIDTKQMNNYANLIKKVLIKATK